jgi:hypothetical protein
MGGQPASAIIVRLDHRIDSPTSKPALKGTRTLAQSERMSSAGRTPILVRVRKLTSR